MKIEIDLNDILGDESGAETLQESVRRQVIDSVTKATREGIGRKIDQAVAATIQAEIKSYLTTEMPTLLATIMDAEFAPVSTYGDRGAMTTFRKELVKGINEQMKYVRTSFSSDRNPFTRAVDDTVGANVETFKAEFSKLVNAQFTASAMQYATSELKKKLGIS